MDFKKLFESDICELTPLMEEQFEKYYNLLVSYNKKVNLTAITERDEVYLKHF